MELAEFAAFAFYYRKLGVFKRSDSGVGEESRAGDGAFVRCLKRKRDCQRTQTLALHRGLGNPYRHVSPRGAASTKLQNDIFLALTSTMG